MSIQNEVVQGTTSFATGAEQVVATLTRWNPKVSAFVDATTEAAAKNSTWRLYNVTTATSVLVATAVVVDPTHGAEIVFPNFPNGVDGGGSVMELRAVRGAAVAAGVPVRAAIVGWDPDAEATPDTDTLNNAAVSLSPGVETNVGALPWHPNVDVYVQASSAAKGTEWLLRAVLGGSFSSKPIVARGTYQDVSPSRKVLSAQVGAASFELHATTPVGAVSGIHASAFGYSKGGSSDLVDNSNEVVFQPGGTAAGNVFITWAALYAAWKDYPGPLTIVFDGTHNAGVCTVPAGAWAFAASVTEFRGVLSPSNAAPGPTEISFAGGSSITPAPQFLTDVWVVPLGSSAPPLAYSGSAARLCLRGTTRVESNVARAAIVYTTTGGGDRMSLRMQDQAVLHQNTGTPAAGSFELVGAGGVNVDMYDSASIQTDALKAGITTQFVIRAFSVGASVAPSQAGVTGSASVALIDSVFDSVTYRPGGVPSPGVYNDFDALATAVGANIRPLQIFIDTSLGAAAPGAGTYTFASVYLKITGAPGTFFTLGSNVILSANVREIHNVRIVASGTTTPITLAPAGSFAMNLSGSAGLESSANVPVITRSAGDLTLVMMDGAFLLQSGGGTSVVRVTGAANLVAVSQGANSINANTLGAPAGQAFFSPCASTTADTTQAGLGGGVLPAPSVIHGTAAFLAYDETLHTPALAPTDTQAMLDLLKRGTAQNDRTNLTDADSSGGQGWFGIPAATLSANRVRTLSTVGATAGDRAMFTRLDVTANTYAFVNGGPAAGTLYTMAASKLGCAEFRFDGTNWQLRSFGVQ